MRYGASIAQVSRQHLLHQHVGRLDANAHHTRQQAHHGMRSLAGCMLEAIQAGARARQYDATLRAPGH
jgi:hypothetical protein